ncbi:MAG: LamG-like jellyroll fold domain-containing protein, partial [Cyclobacteriaceae bacterium]
MREPLSAALRIALILCFLPFLSFAQDNALLFDGVDDHVFVAPGPLFDGTQTITFEAWVNPASVAGTDAIASWIDGGGNEATFSIAAGFLALTQNNGTTPATLTGSQNINANEWTHVALVITVGSLNFYVNGVEEIMGTPDPQAGAADMFSIGVSAVSADYFSGLIDEVRIWDTAIDEAQLNSQMFTSLVGNEANLIAYYQFDETTGTILPDLTSSSYDGSLVSFPASTDPNWQASAALTEVFTVINNNDDLVGSFRQAIVDANASVADSVRVEFNFAAPLTLSLVTQLPNITRSMAIDGTTLPTFNFATENMVTLDLSSVINGDGFHIQSVDVSIIGIKLEATQFGVVVNGEAYDNAVIQQNIFEANTTTAISVNNGDNVTIAGNHIGVSGDGLAGTTGGTGIALSGTDGAIIGGDRMAGEGNMIAGSEFSSDLINISGSDFITIEGNILGASTSGSDITNSRGITINNTDNVAIGSADANRRNYIAGIDNAAALSVSNGNQVHIRNNYVGIGIVDTHAIGNNSGNAIPGIRLSTGITNFTIDGNVVSGASQGVNLAGTTNTGSILNNLIGVRPDGTTAFGNTTHGINLTGSSLSAITIGGGGGENIIAYNNIGIRTDQTSFGTIEISENSILCNTTTGIDISGTPAIAAPVISSIRPTTISGTTTSEDNSNILIYEVDASCAGTQGETFIMEGSDVVSGGTWTVSGTFDIASSFVAVVVDDVNSVDAEFGSSEFSAPAAIDPFTVIITDDSGVGSLRWAVGNANSSVDEETITFDLPGVPATWVITTTTAISISGNSNGVIIDGTSQSGYTQWVDMVQIDGPDGFTAATLSLSEPNVEVYGLHFTDGRYAILTDASAADFQIGSATDGNVFQSANQFGLNITGTDGGTIQGNRIGTSKDGLSITGTGASSDGIYLSGASNIQIGGDRFAGEGNLISGNGSGTDYAIDINSSSTTQIEGNLIGTDANGENDLGNTRGINVAGSSSSFTTIGGASPSAVNVIAGNSGAGITVQSAVDNLSIENNLIGITATDIGHSNNRGISIIALGTGGQIIDNTISANTGAGIYLDQFTNDLLIQNNIIGLTTAGVSALGIRNSAAGIQVRSVAGADATTGRVQILDNVITGNGGGGTQNHGIFFQKSGQDIANFLIQRNNIGVESDGSAPSANSTNSRGGIGFSSTITAANDVTIGGLGNENIIAHNFQEGIYFEMAAEPPGLILDINQYFCNGNDAINFTLAPTVDAPVITSATGSGISGTTTSTSGTVEIFSVDASCADNQGATHVGTATISTGTWSLTSEPFDRTLTYVAYVNDATSGPSEFSAAFEPDPFIVTNTDDSGIGSLRWCITNANASASKETITFDIAGVGPWTIPILSQLPTIDLVANLGMIIDGASQPTWDMDAGLMVTLDGSGAGAFDLGLRVEEPNVEIYGLHIINFDRGISSTSGMDNFTIGAPNMGNVIGGNNYGLFIFNTSGGLIQGNRIGTSMDGLSTNGNSEEGIRIASASDNIQIGGDSGAGEGNLIPGNGTSSAEGIQIDNADFIQLYGNLIGTNRNGEDDLGNRVGVLISTGADNIDIGSSTANHGNVISGSDAVANIYLSFTPTNVIIENNIIGLNSSGDTGID